MSTSLLGRRVRRMHPTQVASGLLVGLLAATPLHAQWSVAPTIALGPSIPTGALGDVAREGIALKAGISVRAPRVPVALSAEGLYTYFRASGNSAAPQDSRIGALLVNVTTRRHARRLELYGIAGGGYYWMNGPSTAFAGRSAPGLNVGVGEIIALGSHDYFVELRLHAVHRLTQSGERWMTFMPLLIGVRF